MAAVAAASEVPPDSAQRLPALLRSAAVPVGYDLEAAAVARSVRWLFARALPLPRFSAVGRACLARGLAPFQRLNRVC